MKFYNKVDLELLKDKISLEALEENIATLKKLLELITKSLFIGSF